MQEITHFLSKPRIDQAGQDVKVREKSSQDKKSSLLNVSVWNEKDIEAIEEAQKHMNKWKLRI